MSDLQITFLVIGVLLFAGIAAYSWLQANPKLANRRTRGARLGRSQADDDLDDGRFSYSKKDRVEPDAAPWDDDEEEEQQAEPLAKPKVTAEYTDSDKELDVEPYQSSPMRAARGVARKLGSFANKNNRNRRISQSRDSASNAKDLERRDHEHAVTKPRIVAKSDPEEPLQLPKGANTKGGIVSELVARIKIKKPLEQQELMTLLRQHDFKFHRAIHLYGLNQLTDLWCDVERELSSAQFVDLGLSIQLADRNGAMSGKEAHDFQQMVLAFTNKYDAPFDFSMDLDEALEQGQRLDKIGVRYDSMAVLNIVSKSRAGFRVADVESCARDLIMSPDRSGVFLKTAGQRNDLSVLYRLACSDGQKNHGIRESNVNPIQDLVLYMNVPATANPELVFQEMIDDANKLATWLEGKVVDRHGRAITQRSLNSLLAKVSEISHGLRSVGVQPGDALSKKLF